MRLAAQRRSNAPRRRTSALGFALLAAAVTTAIASPAQATADLATAWGANNSGQLGDGTTSGSDVPVAVSGLSRVAAVSGGGFHSLALLDDGTVMAWGAGTSGQLGDGATKSSASPVAVSGLRGAVGVSAGAHHSLALLGDGTVMAWGANGKGQLGDGSVEASDLPVAVSGLSHVIAVSAGANHSLALLEDGAVMAWGANGKGQLGDASTEDSEVPVPVSGLSTVMAISAGADHSLALLRGRAVMAWGANGSGQLGNGTETDTDVPVAVSGLGGIVAVSAGETFSLARVKDGTVKAWGGNAYGQLGDGTSAGPETCGTLPALPCSKIPTAVGGLSRVAAVSAGQLHSLALLSNGRVMAWGENNAGQLGDGTTEGPERCSGVTQACSATPLEVTQLSGVVGIAAGGEHSLAFGSSPPPPTELPELGRCVRVRKTGAYSNRSCVATHRGHRGAFEWLRGPGARPGFTIAIPEAVLETLGQATVSCRAGALEGQWTGAKKASVTLAFRGCVNRATGAACGTSTSSGSEIKTTAAIEAELGLISGGSQPRVGLDLRANGLSQAILTFTCGGYSPGVASEPWIVEGSVIGQLGLIDKMTTNLLAHYRGTAGAQVPEFFEALPPDTPIVRRIVSSQQRVEQAALIWARKGKATVTGANEEPLEIKAS
jgi:alpha-tubulin suppressor-like RCC1 family protein